MQRTVTDQIPTTAAKPSPSRRDTQIAALAVLCILAHLIFRYVIRLDAYLCDIPLLAAIAFGGVPLLVRLARHAIAGEFGSDLLAGVSIVASALLGQFLVAAIVILMLSGGTALEQYATRRASSALRALAKRMPSIAHRRTGTGLVDIPLDRILIGDKLVVLPHEICPVDGTVLEGHSSMDESYLTGEPFVMSKTPGSSVLSGAVNGETALTIAAVELPVDSRYAKIMRVMEESERNRPHLRRIGDRLGAWYTPLALAIAALGWILSGDPMRFLAVVVIATPCPLLIAIPVAILGAVSVSARRGIVIRNPGVLEQIDRCPTLIFDKTGTLTHGRPSMTELKVAGGFDQATVLRLAASLEQYSKHPLAGAILRAAEARELTLEPASLISERPGDGLRGIIGASAVRLTSAAKLTRARAEIQTNPAAAAHGLECVVEIDDAYAGVMRFRDEPREGSGAFLSHLKPRHRVHRLILLSGDRASEVRYLADALGIEEMHAGKSPEEKVAIVTAETRRGKTLFIGDGINDAPAMVAATVGVAFGPNSDVTAEAADAVVLEATLAKIDELIHISRRMRRIALQSAVGGMALSFVGMLAAAMGLLAPIAGAAGQEFIDLIAVLNALRVAIPPDPATDF